MSTLRFCPRCRTDVEDAGGFCLLGHRFPVAEGDPVADLRAEVDSAFEKVRFDLEGALSRVDQRVPASVAAAPSAPLPVYEQLRDDDSELVAEIKSARHDVWSELRDDKPISRDDPIVAFSPSPRAEWGPDRSRRPWGRR